VTWRFAIALALSGVGIGPGIVHARDDLRLVLQADPNAQEPSETASISEDGRYVLSTAPATGLIAIWDTASGQIIDRVQLPVNSSRGGLVGTPYLSADATQIVVRAFTKQASPYACEYSQFTVNLADRAIARTILRTTPPGKTTGFSQDEAALCDFTLPDPAPYVAKPASRWQVEALTKGQAENFSGNALRVIDMQTHVSRYLNKTIPDPLVAAALSPDAHSLAYINVAKVFMLGGALMIRPDHTRLVGPASVHYKLSVFNLATSQFLDPIDVIGYTMGNPGLYRPQLAWRDATHLVLTWAMKPGMISGPSVPPDNHVYDVSGVPVRDTVVPGRCFTRALAGGGFVGADQSTCVTGAVPGPSQLWRYDTGSGWKPLPAPELAGLNIDTLVVATDQTHLAVATELHDPHQKARPDVRIVDLTTGRVVAEARTADVAGRDPVRYLRDGRLLIATYDTQGLKRQLIWQPGKDTPRPVASDPLSGLADTDLMFSDGTTLLTSHQYDIGRTVIDTRQDQPPLAFVGAVAGDFTPDHTLFWAASANGGLRFWSTANWSEVLSLYLLPDQTYFALAPSGHYDTNLGPDSNLFRWIVRDAPLQSLAPQTFMRDYFNPRLSGKVLDGSENTSELAPILSLDRVLPKVQITAITKGPTPDTALVSLTVREGFDPRAANGKTRSGLYNLRLFRNNALIAQWPETAAAADTDLAGWRRDNALRPGRDGAFHITYLAHVPTAEDNATSAFSAYAFNTDRVKSDTATMAYARPAMAPRPRRAYVLTIGINAYAQSRLQLHYAVNDARLLAERLSQLPGHDVHQVVLAGDKAAGPVTKALIAAALDLLAGRNRAAALARLSAAGIDGSGFARATPDDLVIMTFSGHGWADPRGTFYLVPADAVWPDTAQMPTMPSLISTGEMTAWLRGIDAGAMALVIDACHSAASVATTGFKPGPMGDPGLGQLAFDKGIRILAATQADDVALEDAALHQGLLTYALAGEGLDAKGFGRADLDADGRIMIDEWLRYALRRLPMLSKDERLHHFGHGLGAAPRFTIITDSQAMPPKPQDPALFDFNAGPGTTVLREHGTSP
jgi:hypothetical protein